MANTGSSDSAAPPPSMSEFLTSVATKLEEHGQSFEIVGHQLNQIESRLQQVIVGSSSGIQTCKNDLQTVYDHSKQRLDEQQAQLTQLQAQLARLQQTTDELNARLTDHRGYWKSTLQWVWHTYWRCIEDFQHDWPHHHDAIVDDGAPTYAGTAPNQMAMTAVAP